MKLRLMLVLALVFAGAIYAGTGTAQAGVKSVYHGGTYFGSVIVEPGQVVDGDLNVMFGDATIEGDVNGDVNVVGGTAFLGPSAQVSGQVNNLGGDVARSVVPWAPSATQGTFGPDYRMMWRIALDVVVVLLFLIFPVRTRMALDRLERHPGLSTAAGLVGWIAVFPISVLLVVSVFLIPLIPIEFVALALGAFIGTAALALLVGRRLFELLSPTTTPSPLGALFLGLAIITAAELVPVVGMLVTILVALVGLGSVILAFVNDHTMRPPGIGAPGRPPMSGPPMPAA